VCVTTEELFPANGRVVSYRVSKQAAIQSHHLFDGWRLQCVTGQVPGLRSVGRRSAHWVIEFPGLERVSVARFIEMIPTAARRRRL